MTTTTTPLDLRAAAPAKSDLVTGGARAAFQKGCAPVIAVHFSKDLAARVLDALSTGKPIPPPKGRWTGNDMLTLAGLLYAGVFSQGPQAYQAAGVPASAFARMHAERREAVEADFHRDIHDGIEFLSDLAFKVMDDQYDAACEPDVAAVLYTDERGEKALVPVKGFKGHP